MAETPVDPSTGAASTLGSASGPDRTAHACGWGYSTLYTQFPQWLSAWDAPWSCRHPAHPGPLETVETCTTCPDWRPQASVNVETRD